MRIYLDNEGYTVSQNVVEDLVNNFSFRIIDIYKALPTMAQMGVKQLVRGYMYKMEEKLPEDIKREIRPLPGADPVLHLLQFVTNYGLRMVKNVDIDITSRDREIISVAVQPSHSD